MFTTVVSQSNHRNLAVLRAVAAGRAEVSCSCEPDLLIDGLPCCDHAVAGQLTRAGLLAAEPVRSEHGCQRR